MVTGYRAFAPARAILPFRTAPGPIHHGFRRVVPTLCILCVRLQSVTSPLPLVSRVYSPLCFPPSDANYEL